MQSVRESVPQFFLKLLVTTFVYFKLSIFQRHHAQHRVFPTLNSREIGPVHKGELVEQAELVPL